jgi:hypothetical protein
MALSSIGPKNVTNSAWQLAMMSDAPLKGIREGRESRRLADLEQYKADTERMKAGEYVTAGARGREAAATMQEYASKAPKLDRKTPEKYIETLNDRIAYFLESPYTDHQAEASKMAEKLDTLIGATKGGTGTVAEASTQSQMDLRAAQATGEYAQAGLDTAETAIRQSLVKSDMPEATGAAKAWAESFVKSNDPNKQGWMGLIRKNYGIAEVGQLGLQLAARYDYWQRMLTIQNNYIPPSPAEVEAKVLEEVQQGGGLPFRAGGAPVPSTSPQQMPMSPQGGGSRFGPP